MGLALHVVEDGFQEAGVGFDPIDGPDSLDLDRAVRYELDLPPPHGSRDIDPQRLRPGVRKVVRERRGVQTIKEPSSRRNWSSWVIGTSSRRSDSGAEEGHIFSDRSRCPSAG